MGSAPSGVTVLSIGCWNARSLEKENLDVTLRDFLPQYDVLFVCETWLLSMKSHLLKKQSTHQVFVLPATKRSARGRASGGCVMFVKHSFLCTQRYHFDFGLHVTLDINNVAVHIFGVYMQYFTSDLPGGTATARGIYNDQLDQLTGFID